VKWTLVFLACATVMGLVFAGHLYFGCARLRRPITWGQAVRITVTGWYIWAALAPLVFSVSKRFSFEGSHFVRSLLAQTCSGLACAYLAMKTEDLIGFLIGAPGAEASPIFSFQLNFLIYWAIAAASLAIHYYRRYREYQERSLKASQLEASLAKAHLQVLKMQLHPHFLFNTLQAISTLVYRDPEAADGMISRLSHLLRFAVESVEVQEVPLWREIELLKTYVEIEQTRFGDRLRFHLSVDETTADARVPALVLQPLVENSIRHGLAKRAAGGSVELRVRRTEDSILIEIRDDGVGIQPSRGRTRVGVGLANTRARLQDLYGDRYCLELLNAPERGALVKLTIPFSTVEANDGELIGTDRRR
jgi:two-component sensor histidine kinase